MCVAALNAPAAAMSIYSFNCSFESLHGYHNFFSGSITTDGTLGVLAPENIVAWNAAYAYYFDAGLSFPGNPSPPTYTYRNASSETGGTLTFTPGSLIATPYGLVFGSGIPSSLTFDGGMGFVSECYYKETSGNICSLRIL